MPPPTVMPSNLLMAAVTALRTLVNTIQGTEDAATRLAQTVTGLGDAVNMFERLATSRTGKIYLHSNIQMIIFKRFDLDTVSEITTGQRLEEK